jgi:hypothetical protein
MLFRRSPLALTFIVIFISVLGLQGCGQAILRPSPTPSPSPTVSPVPTGEIYSSMPQQIDPDRRYVIYIHGKLIEDEGINAVSPQFGPYEFDAILKYLADSGLDVIGEIRSGPTDGNAYSDHVVDQVDLLIANGVPVQHITVVGFSKGAGIAILASAKLKDPGINYVLMAICGDETNAPGAPTLTGHVLSLYEQSDDLGSTCRPLADRSSGITSFEEIELSTGRQHGTFYAADPAWLDPVIAWIWGSAS